MAGQCWWAGAMWHPCMLELSYFIPCCTVHAHLFLPMNASCPGSLHHLLGAVHGALPAASPLWVTPHANLFLVGHTICACPERAPAQIVAAHRSCTWAACLRPSLTSSCGPCLSRSPRSPLQQSCWTS